MKKKKISLETLKVKSFVTGMESEAQTIKAGNLDSDCCPSINCPPGTVLCHTANCEITKFRTDCC